MSDRIQLPPICNVEFSCSSNCNDNTPLKSPELYNNKLAEILSSMLYSVFVDFKSHILLSQWNYAVINICRRFKEENGDFPWSETDYKKYDHLDGSERVFWQGSTLAGTSPNHLY